MAEKHKSKYKKPENTKYKSRKDLKDYTEDDKKGGLNPKSTGEKQHNVLRKTDKEVVDTGDLFVKYNADDRLYKDIEDGDYDPKHAAKVLKKRQDNDELDTTKDIKDKIKNLTREQKERIIREYVQRKIVKSLISEQPADKEVDTAAPEVDPAAAAPIEPNSISPDTPDPAAAAPAPEAPAVEAPVDPAAVEAPVDPAATAPPVDPAATAPAPTTNAPTGTQQPTPEEAENRAVKQMAQELSSEGGVGQIKLLNNLLNVALTEKDPEDKSTFYKMLRSLAIKKIAKTNNEIQSREKS